MGVVIESSVWEPYPLLYVFLFLCCCFSILFFHYASNSNRTYSLFDHGISSSFLRFQRSFLVVYSLASVMEGLWSVFGEFELASQGIGKEQMVLSLCYGYTAALFAGSFFGVLSDLIGHKKVCLIFCSLHFFVGIWKRISTHPNIFITGICLSLANSIFSYSFETWMVVQHEKQGHRLDSLNDTFWLTNFFESVCLIASQMFANWLIGNHTKSTNTLPSSTAFLLATICFGLITRGWAEVPRTTSLKEYSISFHTHIFGDKRIWLLAWAQACLHFSIGIFWILWAPMVVIILGYCCGKENALSICLPSGWSSSQIEASNFADGREVHLGLIYPCFLGSRMLGSTAFPWLTSGLSSPRTEECLVYAYIAMGLVLSLVAYDYQEIKVLVMLFCLFHACVGFILPSLARLRTMYVPNELRGGMMGLSVAPSNAAILLSLVQGGYYQSIGNAALMAFGVLGLLIAAGCMHALKRWGKQPYQNWHKQ